MRTVADIHALALQTPGYRVRQTDPKDFREFLNTTEQNTMRGFDCNNWVRQLEAMLSHDVSKDFGGDMQRTAAAVRARVLVVVGLEDHMVNPQPALALAHLLRAQTLELDSDCGHLAFSCQAGRVQAAVESFLAE
jgi:homoserine O-acetyltransferase